MKEKSLLLTIGLQVRKHRKSRGLSQEELAKSCGMFRTYLSRIEGGSANPTVQVLEALSGALGIDITDLFHD